MMDPKEHVLAANALVQWFNSQDIGPEDAGHIMRKVIAKLIVGGLAAPHEVKDRYALDNAIDAHLLALVHDINNRLHHARRR